MSTHPYLPLYVDDYEAATAHLTAEEDGIYNRLLRLCWRTPGCSLPNDAAWIARKVRLSTADYERVAKPVVEEFFKVSRGRLVQKRLKAEYDDISRKKAKRVKAGKAGGDAKALKTLTSDPSNATLLLGDMRAFPNPEPEPEEKKEANASSVAEPTNAKPRTRVYPEDFEAAWKVYPHHRGRSSKPNAAALFAKLPADERAGMVASVQRFAPNVAETCGGKGAPDMAVWLKDGKHLNWQGEEANVEAPVAVFNGPPDIRAWAATHLGEPYARSYVDPARWDASSRALLAANPFAVSKLARDLAEITGRWKFTVRLAAANDPKPDLFAEGAAA